MKNKVISKIFLILALILFIYPTLKVGAQVETFSELNIEINVSNETIIITKDTPVTDNLWKQVGILDPKTEKENMDKMGVQAIIYDPITTSTVRLLQKQSNESKSIFHLSLLSEDELSEFMNSFISSPDENTKATIDKYPHNETPFFRYHLEVTQDNIPLTEIIYGTIVNGNTIFFDMYQENSITEIDETFVKELVAETHFTKFLDKSEVLKEQKEETLRLLIGFMILVVISIIWFVFQKKRSKKEQETKKRKTNELTEFYKEQRRKEELNIKDTILYINRTQYKEEVIKTFCYYNEIIKNAKLWIGMIIIILVFLLQSRVTLLIYLIASVLIFLFVYFQGIRIDKLVQRMLKPFTKNSDAIFMFYEDYFTLSGVQFISKYPYTQITDVKVYKDYIYIYLSLDKAFYLKKDGFEQNGEKFMDFMKQKTS
jgi:hypothetical protein